MFVCVCDFLVYQNPGGLKGHITMYNEVKRQCVYRCYKNVLSKNVHATQHCPPFGLLTLTRVSFLGQLGQQHYARPFYLTRYWSSWGVFFCGGEWDKQGNGTKPRKKEARSGRTNLTLNAINCCIPFRVLQPVLLLQAQKPQTHVNYCYYFTGRKHKHLLIVFL